MKWISNYKHKEGFTFEIELDELAGYYFYAYDKDKFDFYDDLQDTIEIAKEIAFEKFQVPVNSWVRVE